MPEVMGKTGTSAHAVVIGGMALITSIATIAGTGSVTDNLVVLASQMSASGR